MQLSLIYFFHLNKSPPKRPAFFSLLLVKKLMKSYLWKVMAKMLNLSQLFCLYRGYQMYMFIFQVVISKTLVYGTTLLSNWLSCTETVKATNNSGMKEILNCSMINKPFS